MTVFRDEPEFGATLDAAAGRRQISAAILEKDYWVTQALRALARDYPADFIFKGGTSLSKGYHLIDRFSEDVDVLVIRRETRNATHRLMKQMASAVEDVLGGPAECVSSQTGVHRCVRIQYPAAHKGGGAISPGVLLEAGIRGGVQPCELVAINCLLGETLQEARVSTSGFEDLLPFDIEALHPGRTLMEKLALVHANLGTDPLGERAAKHVRHYYDIYMLLGDDRALALLEDRDCFGQIIRSIREVNDRWFGGRELRPAGGWAASLAFDSASPGYQHLQQAYSSVMAELYLGQDDPPSLDVICNRVAELADLL